MSSEKEWVIVATKDDVSMEMTIEDVVNMVRDSYSDEAKRKQINSLTMQLNAMLSEIEGKPV